MTINATLQHAKTLLDGLAIPGQTTALTAFVAPPPVNDDQAGPPAVYVWAADGTEGRQAVPRGTAPAAGWKTTQHILSLWVTWFDAADAADADVAFPAVMDAILQALRSSADPAEVTDPLTSAASNLVDLGEDMTWTYVPPQALADQRWLRYDAEIKTTVTEEFQA